MSNPNYPRRLEGQIEACLAPGAAPENVRRLLDKVRGEKAKLDPAKPDAYGSANPGVHDDTHRQIELDRMRQAETDLMAKLASFDGQADA